MSGWLITNARLINEGEQREGDLRIKRGRIDQIGRQLKARSGETVIDAQGKLLLPGMIDTQVQFREPGMSRKGNIASESRAAVAGGITSYLDMPNTSPPSTSRLALADKFSRAAGRSAANYSFYLGASRENLGEIQAIKPDEACGIKISMASATGNLAVDAPEVLAGIFEGTQLLVAAHCEDSATIDANLAAMRKHHGNRIPAEAHALIHSREACLKASTLAVELARQHGTRLHVLQLSTADELPLFDPGPIEGKQVTADVSIQHLYFIDADYDSLGNLIKCNPAIKTGADRKALRRALREQRLDIIATNHAPHLLREKTGNYESAAAGLPLVQYALPVAWSLVAGRTLSAEALVEKIAHNPARRFEIRERGYIREGYRADLVLLDPKARTVVDHQPMLSQCGWTPFAGRKLPARVTATWVNGSLVWRDGLLTGIVPGERLEFDRPSS
ncbi:MAG: dihydroorotase [Wenzhouxiangella sp.]|nr:dihydroorotase [Wenzhouxiangella sp.]TVR97424.1 MAG: dihydroorotase [Wenzhouxiangellaceae bacterium]